ncbi:MAG: hypothetical protein L6Q54_13620 [Leptospiraceae bacterium]|nr:hypothetical protein [Leptospiraceae bacterium]MCK6382273.1 hypothetical protein [Leptospiraceae bacterium]
MKKVFLKGIVFCIFTYSVVSAYKLKWISDDAFISLRYAKNFVNGFGLVFNQSEKIEGYTNFLWTILLTIPHYFQLDPVLFSEILGIIFYASTLLVLFFFSRKIQTNSIFIPIAFLGFSFHRHSQIFATSGLETSLFTFLIVFSFSILIFSKNISSLVVGFFLLALAVLTRMDGMIFYISGVFAIFVKSISNAKNSKNPIFQIVKIFLITQIPFLFLVIPYWTIKTIYYDSFFPNTYYAKSANLSYFSQGFKYFFLYFNSYYVFYLLPIFFIFIIIKNRNFNLWFQNFKLNNLQNQNSFTYLLLFPAILGYIFYVLKIGGDFMFSRFFIPITPLFYILLEISILNIFHNSRKWIFLSTIFITVLTLLRFNPYKGKPIPIIEGISDESEIYKRKSVEELTVKLKSWREVFIKNQIRIAFGGSQAIFAYYTDSPFAIEVETGLTDSYIARLPLNKRGRIGHEKNSPLNYLLERKIHFHLNPPEDPKYNQFRIVQIKGFPGFWKILNEDEYVMRNLSTMEDFLIK